MLPKVRKECILIAAIRVARKPGGWSTLTRAQIASEAQCSDGLVSRALGDMADVRRAVMRAAIKYEYLDLIAQGIASGYKPALTLSPVLKHRAIACLVNLGE